MAKKVDCFADRMDAEMGEPVLARPYPRVQKLFHKPTLTRASEMPSTDLKTLVRRYQKAGALPPSQLSYGDVSGLPKSRLEAMERIHSALSAFEELPLKVRQAVGHDPRALENWIATNPQLASEYGLFAQAPPQASSPESPPSSGDPGEGNMGAPKGAPREPA